jgi:hypothetical protein
MGTAAATGAREASGAVRPDEFRAALEAALAAADADERIGPTLRAAGLRVRMRFPDAGLVLDLGVADPGEGRLRWSFGGTAPWQPRLELEMDAALGNRYLQGAESLAIAIARGEARLRGESRVALLYVPAARLLVEPYRRIVRERFPRLAV